MKKTLIAASAFVVGVLTMKVVNEMHEKYEDAIMKHLLENDNEDEDDDDKVDDCPICDFKHSQKEH